MDGNFFSKHWILKEAFSKHVLLKLYTDTVPRGIEQTPDAKGAVELRGDRFGSEALPLYALLRPTGKSFEIVWKDEQGLISDVPAFIKAISR